MDSADAARERGDAAGEAGARAAGAGAASATGMSGAAPRSTSGAGGREDGTSRATSTAELRSVARKGGGVWLARSSRAARATPPAPLASALAADAASHETCVPSSTRAALITKTGPGGVGVLAPLTLS
jgi:hypothetical protein